MQVEEEDVELLRAKLLADVAQIRRERDQKEQEKLEEKENQLFEEQQQSNTESNNDTVVCIVNATPKT